jgi:hypothetical protein
LLRWHPRPRLLQQQPDRIPRPRRMELGMRRQRRRRPRILSLDHPDFTAPLRAAADRTSHTRLPFTRPRGIAVASA